MSGSQTSNLSLPPGYSVGDVGEWKTLPWPDDQELKLDLLDNSLGPALIDWAEWRTDEPGLLNDEGEPWRFTDGQARFLILWYAFDEDGRFIYRRGIRRGSKGTGKDPFAAAMCCMELLGPSQLWWDGVQWVGKRHDLPLVQIASNSEAQSKALLRVANSMLGSEAVDFYQLDKGQTATYIKGGGARMEVLTASERSAEGNPATFCVLNEALALDTPIPTPSGWTTMGDIEAGDWIIGSQGKPVQVVEAFDTQHGRDCYEVTFRDGTSFVASDGHLWTAKFSNDHRPLRTMTTQEMFESGRHIRVPRNAGIDTPETELPINPYFLGYWLGDGDKQGPIITVSDADAMPLRRALFERSLTTKLCRRTSKKRAQKVYVSIPGRRTGGSFDKRKLALKGILKEMGLTERKFVPSEFLHAGSGQRMELLRGLMDSDGCVDKNGRCVFVNNNEDIADAVCYLARSFGEIVKKNWATDPRSRIGGNWRVEWTPRYVVPVSLPRKAQRIRFNTKSYAAFDLIVDVTPVPSVPVRCIRVDAEDSLFVAGEGWKLTHNTHHMTDSSGGKRLASVARRNVGKSKRSLQARIVELTNAHSQGNDSVGERSFEAWQKQVSGKYKQLRKDILYDSIEADPRLDFYDEKDRALALKQAYSDAPWADLKRLGDEIVDPELSAAEAIRFYLNGVAEQEDAYVAAGNFAALADPSRVFVDGDQIALFLDCSKSTDATALMGCRIKDGFNQTLGVWQRPRGPRGEGFLVDRAEVDARVREVFDTYKVVWFGVDPSPAKDDSTEASYWKPTIDQWHRDFRRRLRVWATPGNKGNSVMWDMRLSSPGGHDRNRKFAQEVEVIQQAVDEEGLEGPFRHDGDPALVAHVNNTRARFNKFGLAVGKKNRDSTQLVDLCVAMIGANVGRREALNSGKVRAARSGNSPRFLALK